MAVTSATRGVRVNLHDAQTAGNGLVLAIPSQFNKHKVYIKASSGVSAGAVQLEAASSYDYAGTWGQIGGGPITLLDDTELAIDFEGTYQFIRARVSTDVVGGTVSIEYVGY